jgi:long-chain acyl-CoA synthetase
MVFLGYYKDEEKTNEALDSDGWLKSGDIGELDTRTGALRIVDRKSNIFKLSQGEYISSDKIQRAYARVHLAQGGVFVHGDSKEDFCVAIVGVEESQLNDFLAGLPQESTTSTRASSSSTQSKSRSKKSQSKEVDKK